MADRLDIIKDLVQQDTQHKTVEASITPFGIRFLVTTQRIKGLHGTSAEQIAWRDMADTREKLIEAAYLRAINRADEWAKEQQKHG